MSQAEKENLSKGGVYNPFPGLRPFIPDEHHLFFGREGQSEEVRKKLADHKFVAVVGASGSGKSSLIYCGVIPELRKSTQSAHWNVISMRPGNDPLGNMSRALSANMKGDQEVDVEQSITDSVVRKNSRGLITALEKLNISSKGNTLIVVDQFEELFRYKASRMGHVESEDSLLFVNLLVEAVNQSELPIYIILTMRSDYIGECSQYQELTDLINNSNYLIPQMNRKAYKKAIEGPLSVVNTRIEDGLVEKILDDLGESPDQLPVLQHVMMRTWAYWRELNDLDRAISFSDYEAVGKLEGALSQHADEAFEELNEEQKSWCETLFKTITEKGNDNRGTRLPTRIEIIARIAKCSPEDLIPVIDVFRAEGRSFLTPSDKVSLSKESVIDISHESLMRIWNRLRVWVDEEAAAVQMYLRLTEASEMYMEGRTGLWRPPDLQLALNWRDESRPNVAWAERINPAFERALVYLNTSEKEYLAEEENKLRMQRRQLKRSRIMALVLGSAAIISLGFMILFFMQQMQAEAERQYALEQEKLATEEAQNALEQQQRAEEASQEAQEASLQAQKEKEIAEAERQNALLQEKRARDNAQKAEEQRMRAEEAAEEARIARNQAVENEKLAREQEEEALRLRMVSTARTMAVKSVQTKGNIDLRTLLAYQAYLFNNRFKGQANDPDIYTGLYEVSKYYGVNGYHEFDGHEGAVKSIAFAPGSETFYTTGDDGRVLAWSISDTGYTEVYNSNAIGEYLAVSPDGKNLALISTQLGFTIIDVKTRETHRYTGTGENMKAVAYLKDKLLTSTNRSRLLVWNLETGEYDTLVNPGGLINTLTTSPDGSYIAGGCQDGTVLIWRGIDDPDPFVLSQEELGPIQVVRFQNKHEILAIGDREGIVEIWNTQDQKRLSQLNGHTARVMDIEFSPDDQQMATASTDGQVKIWNTQNYTQPPLSFDDNEGFVNALAFGPLGKTLLSGSAGKERNLLMRPTEARFMVDDLCSLLSRNFTEEEWRTYVGEGIEYEETCQPRQFRIQIRKEDK